MTDKVFWQTVFETLEERHWGGIQVLSANALPGGCISRSSQIVTDCGVYFGKRNVASAASMFTAEAFGLREMRSVNAFRVPRSIAAGSLTEGAYHLLEWIQFGKQTAASGFALGKGLAGLHKKDGGRFGWGIDNHLGSTPQVNEWSTDWLGFFRRNRLEYQFERAKEKGFQFSGERPLLERLELLFEDYEPRPSLIHGDLWNGNVGFGVDGRPVIFDPACYYGDREAEFGIIELFGGFPSSFYDGYQSEWPLDSGFKTRLPVYKLYHQLNHLNLFGGSYALGVEETIQAVNSRL